MVNERMKWWKDDKFGMMIHWGIYSHIAGEWKGQRMEYIGEWIMSRFEIPVAEYELVAKEFDISGFDAEKVALTAKNAGMKYIVFTSKHHDGFAMYHSKVDSFNITEMSPHGRDPLKELAEACKKHGIKLCLYYSHALDWHEKDAGGGKLPGNKNMCWGNNWDFPDYESKVFSNYFQKKAIPQIKELLTNYGEIWSMWFDCPATISEEECKELYNLVTTLQPQCIMNSRIGHGMGDYRSLGDNLIPAGKIEGDWEAMSTLNDTWGYKYFDDKWKPSKDLIPLLAGIASKNINYMINIGPDGNGRIPEPTVKILGEMGEWMSVNSEAIHNTTGSPFTCDFNWGFLNSKGKSLYAIINNADLTQISINGIKSKVMDIKALKDSNIKVEFEQVSNAQTGENYVSIVLPNEIKGDLCPVLKMDSNDDIVVDNSLVQQSDKSISLPAVACDIHNNVKNILEKETDTADTEAQRVVVNNKISIAPLGCTNNWFLTENYVTWDFKLYTPGKYSVQITTSGVRHDNPWEGGHKIVINVGDKEIKITIKKDFDVKSVNARYYTQAVTICGEIELDKTGEYQLKLSAEEIQNNNNVGLAVVNVNLVPIQ